MTSLPTKTLPIRGGAEKVRARPASEDDWPGIVELNCSVPDMPWPRPPEEMTPDERAEYGGWWMSLETLEDLYALYVERSSPVLVAEDASGRIVGHLDLWLAEEPDPVGRNAFVEIVQEHAEYLGSGLENALLGYAADVARILGHPALDGSLGIGGLSTDYYEKRKLGFSIWDEHDCIDVSCQPGHVLELVEVPRSGRVVEGVVVLGRWAPSEFIWLTRWEEGDHHLETSVAGARCLIEGLDAVHVRGSQARGEALDATFYVPAEKRHDARFVSDLLCAYAAYGAENGYRMFRTIIPAGVTSELKRVGILSAGYAGTCLRMHL